MIKVCEALLITGEGVQVNSACFKCREVGHGGPAFPSRSWVQVVPPSILPRVPP